MIDSAYERDAIRFLTAVDEVHQRHLHHAWVQRVRSASGRPAATVYMQNGKGRGTRPTSLEAARAATPEQLSDYYVVRLLRTTTRRRRPRRLAEDRALQNVLRELQADWPEIAQSFNGDVLIRTALAEACRALVEEDKRRVELDLEMIGAGRLSSLLWHAVLEESEA